MIADSAMLSYQGLQARNHASLKDTTAEYIRDEIVAGRLGPGAKVDQDQIAEILGISRLPVREALIELAQKGFVTSIPRRGAFVVQLGIHDIEDHYRILGMVFSLTAKRASEKLIDSKLVKLKAIHEETLASRELSRQHILNREFYWGINAIGASNLLLSVLRHLSGALPLIYYRASPSWSETEANFREQMLDTLGGRDTHRAAKVAEEHMNECSNLTIEELRARGYWASESAEGRVHR